MDTQTAEIAAVNEPKLVKEEVLGKGTTRHTAVHLNGRHTE